MLVLSATLPLRGDAPSRKAMASTRVVLPADGCPTKAMLRNASRAVLIAALRGSVGRAGGRTCRLTGPAPLGPESPQGGHPKRGALARAKVSDCALRDPTQR